MTTANRKLLFLMVLFLQFFSFSLKAQWVTIPDTAFAHYLRVNFPTCMNGNQMDTTCQSILIATSINCPGRNISDLTGIQYFDALNLLNCPDNALTSLPPTMPPGLNQVYCMSNQLTSLAVPPYLHTLNCSDNPLTALSALPASLTGLTCNGTQLTSLPALPAGLLLLNCQQNQFTSFPQLPAGLQILNCSGSTFTVFPALPNGLINLYCDNCQLASLPSLPASLASINCGYNQLTSLPSLPASLMTLICGYNQLTSLPAFPPRLKFIKCDYNQITVLPALPDSVSHLECNDNQLPNLPALPQSLVDLYAHDNQLISVPDLPDSMGICQLYNNPNLACLPWLTTISTLYFSNTAVACLPNYGQVTTSYPPLNTLPVCDLFNSNGCNVYWNISGTVYNTADGTCGVPSADAGAKNVKINLWSGGNRVQQVFSGVMGNYSFYTSNYGNYEVSVDTANLPFQVVCPAGNLLQDIITAIDSSDHDRNFTIECRNGFDLAAWSIAAGRFMPGRGTAVDIQAGDMGHFYGLHCAANVSGAVTVTITGPVAYVAPAPSALTPDNVNGNTLTYNVADFDNVNYADDFNILVQTNPTAHVGTQVCITVSVTPVAGDYRPLNNTLTQCYTIVAGVDPNDKQVYPDGNIDSTQQWLTYTIRFQNTGTAEAQHIYVDDTLDADLDESTFQLLAYSHQPLVQLKQNIVRFNFPNINLPDSNANEAASHGYVQYKIKLKENLPVGTVINNTAAIYFDFNAPVITNTTENTIVEAAPVDDYHPFPTEDATWDVYNVLAEDLHVFSYHYHLNGDTVIANHHYAKVYGVDGLIGAGSDIGGIREDTAKKVYFKSFTGNYTMLWCSPAVPDTVDEIILYDFGLAVGETSYFFDTALYSGECFGPHTVSAIDSVLIFGEYRKRYEMQGGPLLRQDYWIEGIGSEAGLFGTYSGEFENAWALCSFEQSGQTWHTSQWPCAVGINEHSGSTHNVSLYPNPATNTVTITIDETMFNSTLTLRDITGKKMMEAQLTTHNQQLDISSFANGVYFVTVTLREGGSVTRKLVK